MRTLFYKFLLWLSPEKRHIAESIAYDIVLDLRDFSRDLKRNLEECSAALQERAAKIDIDLTLSMAAGFLLEADHYENERMEQIKATIRKQTNDPVRDTIRTFF